MKMRTVAAAVLATALLAIPSSAQPPGNETSYGIFIPSAVGPDGVLTTDLDFDGYDAKNLDDVYAEAPTTDAAARSTTITVQPVYPVPGATNTTGANLILSGAPGARNLTGVTRAATTGDTLTFAVTSMAGAVTSTIKTEGVASPDGWDCDGAASDAECVCNLYTLLTGAGAISGVTVTRTDATCSDERLFFGVTPGTSVRLTVTESDAANMPVVDGTDGGVIVVGSPGDTVFTQGSIQFGVGSPRVSGYASGLGIRSSDGSGYADLYANAVLGSSSVRAGASSYLYWTNRSRLESPSDGIMILNNAAGTQGVKFDTATTDGYLYLTDEAGGTLALSTRGVVLAGSGSPYLITGTAGATMSVATAGSSAAVATGGINLYSAAQTNAGNYASGDVSIYTGATTTDGDTGDLILYTGAAGAGAADAGDITLKVNGTTQVAQFKGADGLLYLGTAAQGVKFDTSTTDGNLYLTDEAGGALTVRSSVFRSPTYSSLSGTEATELKTWQGAGTSPTGAVSLYSGAQTNTGDYASGKLSLYTGATTTDGNTGNVEVYSGTAGAGAADAGNLVFAVNGAPGVGTTALTIAGNGGGLSFGAAVPVGWASSTTLTAPFDGKLIIRNAAGSQGALIDTTASYFAFRNLGDSAYVGAAASYFYTTGTVYGGVFEFPGSTAMTAPSDGKMILRNNGNSAGVLLDVSTDTAFKARVRADNAYASVWGSFLRSSDSALTAATMTAVSNNGGLANAVVTLVTWTNAMVTACGAVKTCDIKAVTLPAGTVFRNAYVKIGTAETALTDLTVSCGRTGAAYIDYIVASNAQAAANTVYGDAAGERGSNLTGYDLPSVTAAVDVYCQFITTDAGKNLADALNTTGSLYVETTKLP